ncbi:MAG TPA: serine/threonine-protein kinase [Gemmatimonadales bacterium]|nr:serine/threonine-protein kinase [Gemmatimonadales bacterium]
MTDVSFRVCDVCGAVVQGGVPLCPACSSAIRPDRSDAERQRIALQAALDPQLEMHERIGRGAFGIVYRATDHALERQVAVKVLRVELVDDELARTRFLRGARVLAQLEHPHIVRIWNIGESGQLAWVVMPLVDGENLAAVLLREGRPAVPETARILVELAEALCLVHEMGLVHRDIKPQHIMLDGRERGVRLLDFTLAAVATGGPRTRMGVTLGTPAYMSPELADGQVRVDGRSDLYSLGVVGYHLLTGTPPFEGTAEQLMEAHRTQAPRDFSVDHADVLPDLARAVMRCLAKRPEDRWGNARSLLRVLRTSLEALTPRPVATAVPAAPPPREPPPTRGPWRIARWVVAASLLLVGYCALR